MWWSIPRLCVACLLTVPAILELPEFITEWDKKWQPMLTLLDLWYVRFLLIVAAGVIITYPQWAAVIRTRMRFPWGSTFWGGLVFTLAWKRTAWKEQREFRRQRRRFEREKKKRGGGE